VGVAAEAIWAHLEARCSELERPAVGGHGRAHDRDARLALWTRKGERFPKLLHRRQHDGSVRLWVQRERASEKPTRSGEVSEPLEGPRLRERVYLFFEEEGGGGGAQ
jgi:hypothetical protein